MVAAAIAVTAAKVTPADAGQFSEGDLIVYPTHGVGRVDRVGPEEIDGYRLNLIRISFEDNHMSLRIPVAGAHTTGLRKLVGQQVLTAALFTLSGRPRSSTLRWAKRSEGYMAKINSGTPDALAEVLRDLQPASDGSVSFSQRNLFELALERLAGEYAAVHQVGKSDAVELLNKALTDARTDRAAQRQGTNGV